jgi:hypothetical protein
LIIQLRPHRKAPAAEGGGDGGDGRGEGKEKKKRKAAEAERKGKTREELFRTVQSQPILISGHLQLPYNSPKCSEI